MTSNTISQRAARRRGELHRRDGDRHVAQAIEARRRVSPRPLGRAWIKPPAGHSVPGFEELREHIQSRLRQAPRYRQKLAQIPFGVNDPVWVDDTDFDVERHVRQAAPARWSDTVDAVMSSPLSPGR